VTGFGARLTEAFDRYGQLCVGIDPHDYLLDEWQLPRSAAGVREFGLTVVEAAAGRVALVKPQVAFFERYGSAGFAALEDVLASARAAGVLTIADAKRGDIGSSVSAYGEAWLLPGSSLEADAVTVTAYTGTGALKPVFELAEQHGKGVFVLSATSNPESLSLQSARVASAEVKEDGAESVAALVAREITEWNARVASHGASNRVEGTTIGSIGVVLGATKNLRDYGIDPDRYSSEPVLPVLAPGFGHQGATFSSIHSVFGSLTRSTIVSASRSVLTAGKTGLAETIGEQSRILREAIE
jgi:orotidine-5'-phosphate decarboxylase